MNFLHSKGYLIDVTVGITGRTSSAPNSAHRLIVDKVQELRSGILTYTSLVVLQMSVETRVKSFYSGDLK